MSCWTKWLHEYPPNSGKSSKLAVQISVHAAKPRKAEILYNPVGGHRQALHSLRSVGVLTRSAPSQLHPSSNPAANPLSFDRCEAISIETFLIWVSEISFSAVASSGVRMAISRALF